MVVDHVTSPTEPLGHFCILPWSLTHAERSTVLPVTLYPVPGIGHFEGTDSGPRRVPPTLVLSPLIVRRIWEGSGLSTESSQVPRGFRWIVSLVGSLR